MNKTLLLFLTCCATNVFAQAKALPPASTTATNAKPDIKAIFGKDSVFTNEAGLVIQKVSSTLWVSRTEVTQKAYQKVTGSNPSSFPGDDRPVENLTWNAAIAFCQDLTASEAREEMLPEGFAYWLPTQAQWESLAAGTPWEQAVTSAKTSRRSNEPVGSLGANGAGLCDVLGNVMEWTADRNATYDYRVARGAAWNTSLEVELRAEFRVYKGPNESANNIGLRVVLIPDAEVKVKVK